MRDLYDNTKLCLSSSRHGLQTIAWLIGLKNITQHEIVFSVVTEKHSTQAGFHWSALPLLWLFLCENNMINILTKKYLQPTMDRCLCIKHLSNSTHFNIETQFNLAQGNSEI